MKKPVSLVLSLVTAVTTRTRILAVVALILIWSLASLLPHYSPTIREHVKTRLDEARQKIPKVKVDWHSPGQDVEDPRSRFNRSKVALLIEPHPLPHLIPQLLHTLSIIPYDWHFLFIGTSQSAHLVRRGLALRHQQATGKLDVLVLPPPWNFNSHDDVVHRLMTDIRFYDEVLPDVEWLLVYGHDSIFCANAPSGLDSWLDWDWVGGGRGGGITLRKVSAIRRVLAFQERHDDDTVPEDEWFKARVRLLPGARVASWSTGSDDVLGFSLRDISDESDPARRREILNYCPEIAIVADMKLERERCPLPT